MISAPNRMAAIFVDRAFREHWIVRVPFTISIPLFAFNLSGNSPTRNQEIAVPRVRSADRVAGPGGPVWRGASRSPRSQR
jgi:hypothetical protein